jgi:hypothetical protein
MQLRSCRKPYETLPPVHGKEMLTYGFAYPHSVFERHWFR